MYKNATIAGHAGKAIFNIETISIAPLDTERVWGAAIIRPRAREEIGLYALELEGWVLKCIQITQAAMAGASTQSDKSTTGYFIT